MQMTIRLVFTLTSLACLALLGFGYYLQFFQHLEPCPMCIFQRLCYFGIALIAGIAALHNPRTLGARVYAVIGFIIAAIGAGIAGRQTWLQHLPPDQVPECGPGLDFMLEMYPLGETIMKTLRGSGDCAVVDWSFLTLSIAEWSIACFTVLIVVLATVIVRAKNL